MPKQVMVVEDDEDLNEILQYNLERAGYHVIPAYEGNAAIREVVARPPDLILLDVMLPRVDGWAICRFLESREELRRIPIIVFTAKSALEDFDLARQFNLAGFFTKPYATADVLRHVEKVLSSSASA